MQPEITYIFIDTNRLEDRSMDKNLFLSEFKLNTGFWKLHQFIKDNKLDGNIVLCIPEIVWLEVKEHLIKCYNDNSIELGEKIDRYRKVFGGILDVEYRLAHSCEEDIVSHIDSIMQQFLDREICKIISYPRESSILENLVEKAIKQKKPFCATGSNNKKYTDAGFKDAIIVETINAWCSHNKGNSILLTDDGDLQNAFGTSDFKVNVFKEYEPLMRYIENLLGLNNKEKIRSLFEKDQYIREKLLDYAGQILDDSVTNYEVADITADKDDEAILRVSVKCIINESVYMFEIEYDSVGNDFIDVQYTITND